MKLCKITSFNTSHIEGLFYCGCCTNSLPPPLNQSINFLAEKFSLITLKIYISNIFHFPEIYIRQNINFPQSRLRCNRNNSLLGLFVLIATKMIKACVRPVEIYFCEINSRGQHIAHI